MAVTIKTPQEIEKMRIAGRLAAEVLRMIAPKVQAGITTGAAMFATSWESRRVGAM